MYGLLSEKVEFWKPADSSNMSSKFIMSVVGTENVSGVSEKVEFWKPAESSNMSSKFIMSVVGTKKQNLYNVARKYPKVEL